MKKTKVSVSLILLIVFVVIIVYIVGTSSNEKYSQLITLFTAVSGIFLIMYQLNKDHKIKKAEFIYSLNNTFTSNEEIHYIYVKLKEYRDDNVELTPEDGRRMADYVMFFDIMGYLLEERMITISMVDSLFAIMFFMFMNNEYAHKYQFNYPGINRPIIELYVKWYNYRLAKDMPELYPKNSFTKFGGILNKNPKGYLVIDEDKMVVN